MITKSYEIKKNLHNFLKYNLFLLYGENYGLKKDIKESIISSIRKQDNNLEILTVYENDIIDNEDILLEMLESRNALAHTYNEDQARDIYEKCPQYLTAMEQTFDHLSKN